MNRDQLLQVQIPEFFSYVPVGDNVKYNQSLHKIIRNDSAKRIKDVSHNRKKGKTKSNNKVQSTSKQNMKEVKNFVLDYLKSGKKYDQRTEEQIIKVMNKLIPELNLTTTKSPIFKNSYKKEILNEFNRKRNTYSDTIDPEYRRQKNYDRDKYELKNGDYYKNYLFQNKLSEHRTSKKLKRNKVNSLWEKEQLKRKRQVKKTCLKFHVNNNPKALLDRRESLFNLLVDDRHEALYCYVPKVSSVFI